MSENIINYGLIGSNGRLGCEVAALLSQNGFNLTFEYNKDFVKSDEKPQLIIDCSLPEVFPKTIEFVIQYNTPLIIATTGLSDDNFEELKKISECVPVVQSFNFSVGIQIMLKLVNEVKKIVPDWDNEISEVHHRFKKDKPSGSALMIKNALGKEDVNISSLRLGNVAGVHTISFGGLGEVLSITHDATSRRTFAEGILRSANYVINKKPGLYSFTDVIFN